MKLNLCLEKSHRITAHGNQKVNRSESSTMLILGLCW